MKNKLVTVWAAAVCTVCLDAPAIAQEAAKEHSPVIDMHLHALPAKGWPGGPSFLCPGMDFAAFDPRGKWDPNHLWDSCPNPIYPVAEDEELLRKTLAAMDRYNVVLAATSGLAEYVRRYRQAAPKRILLGSNTLVANLGTPDSLRELNRKGELAVLGEIGPPVEGISPEDERLDKSESAASDVSSAGL